MDPNDASTIRAISCPRSKRVLFEILANCRWANSMTASGSSLVISRSLTSKCIERPPLVRATECKLPFDPPRYVETRHDCFCRARRDESQQQRIRTVSSPLARLTPDRLKRSFGRARSFGGEAVMRLPSIVALLASSLTISVPIAPATAHPGGLNAEGCHNNRKTGGYHCHRGPSASPSTALRAVSTSSRREFANCAQARAAGAAPVRVGDPGYARHLDRDGDGVGCE